MPEDAESGSHHPSMRGSKQNQPTLPFLTLPIPTIIILIIIIIIIIMSTRHKDFMCLV
jgi:hypothetical protein